MVSCLLLAGPAHAQFGLRAGANFATLATPTSANESRRASADGRLGYHAGVFYEHAFTRRWSIVPEIHYSHQRQRLEAEDYSIADGGYYGRYRLRLGYLNVPVLGRATFGNRHKVYVEAGPQLGILQGAFEEGTEAIGTIVGSYEVEVNRPATDRYRRLDVSLCAGIGLKLPAGLGVGLRASTGLRSLTQPYSNFHNYGGRLRSQVVQAALSY